MYAMAQEARTPLYKPCSMCHPKGYRLWAFLVWKQVDTFCPFWSGMGYGFRGNYGNILTYLSFEFQVNKKEIEIYKFEMHLKKFLLQSK